MELNKEELHFLKSDGVECEYCGISSFDHIHRVGTLPKDFEISDRKEKLISQCLCGKHEEPHEVDHTNNGSKESCLDCKNLPEGKVVKGHDHRILEDIWLKRNLEMAKHMSFPILPHQHEWQFVRDEPSQHAHFFRFVCECGASKTVKEMPE